MSSGQRPRTLEYFPHMKVRGNRRRARAQVPVLEGVDWGGLTEGFASILNTVGDAAVAGLGVLASVAEGVARVAERVVTQWHEYLGSERCQLDLIASRYHGDPVGRSAAVGEFFTARAHRELDELAASFAPLPVMVENLSGRPEVILDGMQWNKLINRMTGV